MNRLFFFGYHLFGILPWLACLLPPALNAQSDAGSKPYRHAVWAGFAYNIIGFESEYVTGFTPVFGAEFGFKKPGQRLTFLVAASRREFEFTYRGSSHFKKEGINGELGLAFQQSPVGRLSGEVSNGYFGFELRMGRQGYSDVDQFNNPQSIRTETTFRWVKLLGRFGWRFGFGGFFIDIASPIGVQIGRITQTPDFHFSDRGWRKDLVVMPALAIGFRF